jgi:hypothetical protein
VRRYSTKDPRQNFALPFLVERILPPGAESGKHTRGGNEIVCIQEGSVTFEVQGKSAVTLKPDEAFTLRRARYTT